MSQIYSIDSSSAKTGNVKKEPSPKKRTSDRVGRQESTRKPSNSPNQQISAQLHLQTNHRATNERRKKTHAARLLLFKHAGDTPLYERHLKCIVNKSYVAPFFLSLLNRHYSPHARHFARNVAKRVWMDAGNRPLGMSLKNKFVERHGETTAARQGEREQEERHSSSCASRYGRLHAAVCAMKLYLYIPRPSA